MPPSHQGYRKIGMYVAFNHYTYHITWSAEDEEYVGLCHEFPSLSCLEPTADAAFAAIRQVVADILEDMQSSGEAPPTPLAELVDSDTHYPLEFVVAGLTAPAAQEKMGRKSPAVVSES